MAVVKEWFTSNEAADILGIQPPTMRKYTLILEKAGYKMQKNEYGYRSYSDIDIAKFKQMLRARDRLGITLEEAAEGLVKGQYNEDVSDEVMDETPDTSTKEESQERSLITREEYDELLQLVRKQNEFVAALTNAVQESSKDQAIKMAQVHNVVSELKGDMGDIKKSIEDQKQELIEYKEKPQEPEETPKKGFWARLTGKK